MRKILKSAGLLFALALLLNIRADAQYATRKLSKAQEAYLDSLKQVEYNYIFPLWGQQTYQAGFDIPYPAGVMASYVWMEQGLTFENMELGLLTDDVDIPLTPVDFVGFGDNRNTSWVTNVRPDLWIFPFLNVYGLFGYGSSHTEVRVTSPIELTTTVDQEIRNAGFGVLGAFGLGPFWASVDASWNWTKPELLDKPVRVNVMGIRIGNTFVFKQRPQMNIALWAGAMRLNMASYTSGQILMSDALPDEVWENKDELVNNYYDWYNALLPPQQAIVDATPVPDIVDAIDQRNGDALVRYGMDKSPAVPWNMVLGAQYQYNKHWQFRTEAGFLGDRTSFLLSVNYRFRI